MHELTPEQQQALDAWLACVTGATAQRTYADFETQQRQQQEAWNRCIALGISVDVLNDTLMKQFVYRP